MLFVLLSFFFQVAHADVSSCEKAHSFRDFYSCSLKKHPKLSIAEQKNAEGAALVEKAGQWQNPELAFKSVGGKQLGEAVGSTEITLSIPISQLWTLGPQKNVANAERRIAELEARGIVLEVKEELIRDLFRLRQIEDDQELVEETLSAFETIKRQLGARRARGPDQEITLSLVQLATSDYLLKRNHLQVEKSEIHSKLKAIWGRDFEIKKQFLPPLKDSWPKVPAAAGIAQNLSVQKALAVTERSSAEHSVAKSESWPSISVGPVMERNTSGPVQSWSHGFNLTVGLPIFSLNGGARKLSEARAIQAELESTYAIKKFHSEREILAMKYRTAVDSLAKSSSREEVKKKHHRVDSFFKQGLASGGLVIEAHRQIVEYMQSQHEHENAAIDAYIDLMTLTGGDIEGILL